MVYLGIPLTKGRINSALLHPTVLKITSKIDGWKAKLLNPAAKQVLIKHVLSSIPIHLLSAINIPKMVCKALERAFANFFWGSSEEGNKRHWVKWAKICAPTQEGGLGIRSIADVMRAFRIKMGWNLLKGTSLWARFVTAKYFTKLIANHGRIGSVTSPTWRDLLSALPYALIHSRWLIGEGKISFWNQNWSGGGILASAVLRPIPPHLLEAKVCDFNPSSGRWNFANIQDIISPATMLTISATEVGLSNREDRFIWDLTSNGSFSLRSTWNGIRQHFPKPLWTRWLWNKYLPAKLATFCWKTAHAAVPVDAAIQNCGVSLASRCECCSPSPETRSSSSNGLLGTSSHQLSTDDHNNPQPLHLHSAVETLDHLLSHGSSAQLVWSYFSALFDIPFVNNAPILHRIQQWSSSASERSRMKMLTGFLPCFIIWELWKSRNAARFEGRIMSVTGIIYNVRRWLNEIGSLIQAPDGNSLAENITIQLLSLDSPTNSPVSNHILVRWTKPPEHWLKLNTDGSSRGNPGASGGGGVCRDHLGRLIFAFHRFYGVSTNTIAEARAMLDGLHICSNLGLANIILETDSKVIADALGDLDSSNLWNIWYVLGNIKAKVKSLNLLISHTFREGNAVADALARMASEGRPDKILSSLPATEADQRHVSFR